MAHALQNVARMRSWLVILIVTTAAAIAHAGIPLGAVIPPAEVDTGIGKTNGDSVGPSSELLAGVYWASLAYFDTPLDVGFGFVGSWREVRPGTALRGPMTGALPSLRLVGPYIDVAYAIDAHPHWRTWAAGRFEKLTGKLDGQLIDSYGAALRLQTEVLVRGKAGASTQGLGGAVVGTLALGVYVEASHRYLPIELGSNGITAGITIRIPLLAGAGG